MVLTLNDGRTELWQWDTGRTVAVDADCSQVHFSNKVFGRSIDVDVAGGTAIIPDVLLQTDKDLNVWAFVGTTENGYTKISKTFKVNRRNKPADYVFTPTDQMTLQTIQSQIGDLADLTTEAKDTLVAAINEAARTGGGAGSMDLRVADGYVQYSTDGGMTWTNLIAMAELKGADGKSAYAYAVEGGYTGTEAEFAAKLAQEKFANPNALTFAGAVTGSYDGSEPLTVEIPSGGGGSGDGGIAETLIADFTTAEDVTQIDIPISDDLLSFLNNSREIIYEMKFLLPSSDEGTAAGKLQFGHKAKWGMVETYIYDAQCLPTNSSAYASESYLVGRALFSRLTRNCHTIYAFMVKNTNTRATATRAGLDQIFVSGDTFCAIGSIPIGAGSRIRIYARG